MVFEVFSEDKLEYKFFPTNDRALKFLIKAPHDAHIALTTGPMETGLMYEVFIGGWGNTKSVIRRNREKPELFELPTPNILAGDIFKEFWITWNFGRLLVGEGSVETPILEAPCDEIGINHFGIRTGWGATGLWKIEERWPGWKVYQGSHNPGFAPPQPGMVDPGFSPAPPIGFSPQPCPAPPSMPGSGWSLPGGDTGHGLWVPVSGNAIPYNAVTAGFDNEPLFVGRAHFNGALTPGKVVPSHGVCYVPWGGSEHSCSNYEVLCGCEPIWVPISGDNIPPGAFPAGTSETGETLFIGRAEHNGTQTIGKVQMSHRTCYIPYGGEEIAKNNFEILVVR